MLKNTWQVILSSVFLWIILQKKKMRSLENIYNQLDAIQSDCVLIFDLFRDHIFSDIDYYSIVPNVPMWIRDVGNSAEGGLTKEQFELFVRENNNVLTNKLLYKFDCDLLVAALQDRFSMISSMIERFYQRMPYESKYKMEDFDSTTMTMSSADADIFAFLNSIFVFLGSAFDLMAKISTELYCVDTIDYSDYPNLKSKNVQFGDNKLINETLKGSEMIFSRPNIVKKIEAIRNRIIHDGSFDFRQIIYIGYIDQKDYSESCILFPDMGDSYFASYKNRRNFYSESNRINISLPQLLNEILQVINNTTKQIISIYNRDIYINENDAVTYKDDILNWSKSAFKVFGITQESSQTEK